MINSDRSIDFHCHCEGKIDFRMDKGVVIDPSFLQSLMSYKLNIEFSNKIKFFIPDTLDTLITKARDDKEYKEVLERFLTYFSYYYRLLARKIFSESDWKQLYTNYDLLNKNKQIFKIKEEDIDKEVYAFCMETFKNHNFYISMSSKINFLGDILGKILGFSKKHGAIILMKTRRFANLIREKIITLELPKRLDELIDSKQFLIKRIFSFQGGKFVKFFVGVVTTMGGYVHPAIAIPGIILTFMDP